MSRALSASAQSWPVRSCLAGALLLLSAPAALWAGTSSQQNPVATFTTPGVRQVTLQVCNSAGCSSVTKNVTVLDPSPAVTSALLAPPVAEASQLVFFTGAGSGQPPLAFTWQVSPVGGGGPSVSLPGASIWWNTAGVAPGIYTVSLQIQNSAGTVGSLPLPVTLVPATPLDFYTTTPCRIYDSRQGPMPLLSGVARIVQATGVCGIPSGARALAANVTVTAATNPGNMVLYPGNYPQPVASTLHFAAGSTRASHAVLPLATNGTGTLAALASLAGATGNAHLVIDVSGYFAP